MNQSNRIHRNNLENRAKAASFPTIGVIIIILCEKAALPNGCVHLAIPAFTDSITDMCEKVALPNGCVHKSFYMFCIKFFFATGWYSDDSIRVYVRFCGQNMTKYCSRIR